MHLIEPFYNWDKYYNSSRDERSPFQGKDYNYASYSEHIYDFYIDPGWDFIGSDTLYIKILYIDYNQGFAVIEFIGEWNDALNNDVMNLKRNIIDHLTFQRVNKFVLIGENVLNFHGSDDCYYEEWFEEIEEGWIVAMNFAEFVTDEWGKYNVDSFFIFGGELNVPAWRTMKPIALCQKVNDLVHRRIPSF